ncbi:MAG: ABC transporter permease [Gemmatimonadales bacterium]|nr:ABC transporter permease [Gemmatimonadales bacterium]
MTDALAAPGVVEGFLAASVRVATPLLLAATGETIAERSGVINLGIEGAMLAGALAAALASTGAGPLAGLAAGAAAGLLVALVFAAVALGLGANQIITGTAVTLGCIGLTGAVYRRAFGAGGAGLSIPTLPTVELPGLSALPIVGRALFAQPLPTYLALAAVPLAWWALFRTRAGLRLRAAGEAPELAAAQGVRPGRVRTVATLIGGAFAGLAGASLVLAQVGTFAEKMTAGRGFVAIAIVVLGRWNPLLVLPAALLFGALTALQFVFQAMGLAVPYQLFLMLPYALTLVALAGVVGGVRAPAALGK